MAPTRSCLQCGKRYQLDRSGKYFDTDYCSLECFKEDEARLAEGNAIIAEAAKQEQISPLHKLQLDKSVGQGLSNIIRFNSSPVQQPVVEPVKEDEQ